MFFNKASLTTLGLAAFAALSLSAQTIDVNIAPGAHAQSLYSAADAGSGTGSDFSGGHSTRRSPRKSWPPRLRLGGSRSPIDKYRVGGRGLALEPQRHMEQSRGTRLFHWLDEPAEMIRYSYGYSLPRRGFTRNDGTGNTGYSRLTDGDTDSVWKSNPYLTQRFTGESDSLHPQWVIVDLKEKDLIDAIRIDWAAPYAKHYDIQFWTGLDSIGKPTEGIWETFPSGAVTQGKGGEETISLTQIPTWVQFFRIVMTESSNTCDADGPSDPRNCVGYAIRELYVGTLVADGSLHDVVRHTPDQDQTTTYCSSVDPWHTTNDLLSKRRRRWVSISSTPVASRMVCRR